MDLRALVAVVIAKFTLIKYQLFVLAAAVQQSKYQKCVEIFFHDNGLGIANLPIRWFLQKITIHLRKEIFHE